MPTKTPARAYSYLRFSTPEQQKGDSFRRQSSAAERYATVHGLVLDRETTFQDLGVSAYRGRNAETGRLGEFLEAVRTDIIPRGSVLLVESLDRISRQTARKAVRLLEDIIEAGVDVVTLNDGKRYNTEGLDSIDFVMAVLLFIRANEESATKGRRVRAAWDNKRQRATDKVLTARGPGWLECDHSKKPPDCWTVMKDRREVVQRIFKLANSGRGQHAIAALLNSEKVPTFGRASMWHRSSVAKILKNEAVIGRFTPHIVEHDESGKKTRKPTEVREGYYPRIVADEVFENVQAMVALEGARQPASSRPKPVHLLAGVAKCALCGASMTRVYKGARGGKPKLVCSRAKVGAGCTYLGVPVEAVEDALQRDVEWLVSTAPSGDTELDSALEKLEASQSALSEQIENLVEAIANGRNSPALQKRLADLETARDGRRKDVEELEGRISTTSKVAVERRLGQLEKLVKEDADKAAVNAVIRQLMDAVLIDPNQGTLTCQWKHKGETRVMFAWSK